MTRRSPIILVAVPVILLGLAVVAYKFTTDSKALPMRDFVEYYAAGAVNLRGGNPYDAEQLLPVQKAAANDPELDHATMMWNPPWSLVLVTPLGLLPAKAAHLAWLAAQLVSVLTSAAMLWRLYRGPAGLWPVACAVALFFGPFFVLMWYGQVGCFLLLGLAGFLYCHDRDRPAAAGAFAALTALKPHLLFAFGLVMLLDAVATRRGRVALSVGVLTVAAAALAAWAMNPDVYRHYAAAGWQTSGSSHISPKDWYQPLGSYWLRRAIDPDRFAIQFVPTMLTAVVVASYWLTRRKTWDWTAEAPRLIFASVITAAYGAWIFDLVVLLVPVVQAAVWLTTARRGPLWWTVVAGHFALNVLTAVAPVVAVAVSGDAGMRLDWFVYFAPATLVLYLAAGHAATEPNPLTPFPGREGGGGSKPLPS